MKYERAGSGCAYQSNAHVSFTPEEKKNTSLDMVEVYKDFLKSHEYNRIIELIEGGYHEVIIKLEAVVDIHGATHGAKGEIKLIKSEKIRPEFFDFNIIHKESAATKQ